MSKTRFYEIWVWIKGHNPDKIKVVIEALPPLTPMNVRDYCCRMKMFLWKDYTRIRYRRVTRRAEKK